MNRYRHMMKLALKITFFLLIIVYAQLAKSEQYSEVLNSSPVNEGVLLLIVGLGLFFVYVVCAYVARLRALAKKDSSIESVLRFAFKSQKDMIYAMGEAIECRSGETGSHVKRVAKISAYIGSLYGLNKHECEMLKLVSPMHDIGKLAIPESILDKSGRLSDDEFDIVKQHTLHGYKLLSSSQGYLMNAAAIVALEHHEKWDGSGYPYGKSGEEIHIYGRITAIADVIDALLSKRSYKEPWSEQQVVQFLMQQSGKHFQPELAHLAVDNFSQLIQLRNNVSKEVMGADDTVPEGLNLKLALVMNNGVTK